jgi:hypothetical protein
MSVKQDSKAKQIQKVKQNLTEARNPAKSKW